MHVFDKESGGAMEKIFTNPSEELLKERYGYLYQKDAEDMRSEYHRDYTRILHSNAYRRLKHKTQVFFNIGNDHVCTRIEHVQHVESVSYSLAYGLGLDTELTKAIACGHDLGHAPFGHEGENVINERLIAELSDDFLKKYRKNLKTEEKPKLFWHERNGLRFVDQIELLPDRNGNYHNLHLTYAVRDGIISHCGEVDENRLKPRKEAMDLYEIKKCGEYAPFTWEGCIVKISDKIAYLGRDIEDAYVLGFLSQENTEELKKIAREYIGNESVNTTGLMHLLIGDIIKNSTPDTGICLSSEKLELFNKIKAYNYRYIYRSERFNVYKNYVKLIINSIYDTLLSAFEGKETILCLRKRFGRQYPELIREFTGYLEKYCTKDAVCDTNGAENASFCNIKIYKDLQKRDDYVLAVTDFISGMTDKYAVTIFDELITLSN